MSWRSCSRPQYVLLYLFKPPVFCWQETTVNDCSTTWFLGELPVCKACLLCYAGSPQEACNCFVHAMRACLLCWVPSRGVHAPAYATTAPSFSFMWHTRKAAAQSAAQPAQAAAAASSKAPSCLEMSNTCLPDQGCVPSCQAQLTHHVACRQGCYPVSHATCTGCCQWLQPAGSIGPTAARRQAAGLPLALAAGGRGRPGAIYCPAATCML